MLRSLKKSKNGNLIPLSRATSRFLRISHWSHRAPDANSECQSDKKWRRFDLHLLSNPIVIGVAMTAIVSFIKKADMVLRAAMMKNNTL